MRNNILKILFIFYSLCELPDTHLTIATNESVIRQLNKVCKLEQYFDLLVVRKVALLFLVLGYTTDAHLCLLSYSTVETIIQAVEQNEFHNRDSVLLK